MMFRAKNYLNRPMFHGVIEKITLAQLFFEKRCIFSLKFKITRHGAMRAAYNNTSRAGESRH